ncbi:MAG: hypothetical protein JSV82_02345, partial [Planctomycetota bacterium]
MSKRFKNYTKTVPQPLRPYEPGEDLEAQGISVWEGDTIEPGGMIAQNPKDPTDQWYVSKKFFDENYVKGDTQPEKTLHNSDVSGACQNVKDIKVVGNGDMFRLLCKASSENEGWMKSSKAMDTGNGCVVQVTTQQLNPDGSYSIA